jgi:SAM-dependent methyltransferase
MTSLSPQRVNYDLIAHQYDEPLRDHDIDRNLIRFLSERPTLQPANLRILDMGCGTGKQLAANREAFSDLLMVGLDLFKGMLWEAGKRCASVAWVQGNSAHPPFEDNSFDYITNQFSYPHVVAKERMIFETYRVLKPGGRFVMTNIDPWSAARQRDFNDFLPVETFVAIMAEAGFANTEISHQHWFQKEELNQFLEYASQRYRASQLTVIQDGDYREGIARLTAEIEKSGINAEEDSELCLVTVTGDKL